MSSATVKKGAGLYACVAAIVLALVGIVAMFVSNSFGAGYEFSGIAMTCVLAVVGIALVAVAVYTDTQRAEKGPGLVALFALAVAIFLFVYCGVQVVASRALTISGLFSWNSMDTTGWQMFYAAVVSAAGLVLSAVVLTVGCFLPIAKKA